VALLGKEFGAHYVTRAKVTARDQVLFGSRFDKFLQIGEQTRAISERSKNFTMFSFSASSVLLRQENRGEI
jgi:hypothetical protein